MPPAYAFPNSCHLFGDATRLGLISFSDLILILRGSRMGSNCSALAVMHFISSLLGPGHGHTGLLWSSDHISF